MAVKGLPGDSQFPAESAHIGLRLPHGSHGQAEFGGGHLVGCPAVPAAFEPGQKHT